MQDILQVPATHGNYSRAGLGTTLQGCDSPLEVARAVPANYACGQPLTLLDAALQPFLGLIRKPAPTVRLGGMRLTSAEALWRFIARCTEAINRNRTATAIDIGRRGFAEQSEEGLERDSI